MTKRHTDDPNPTWFRLSAETWAMIRDEYLAGATARALAKKYRTSPTSIYRRASEERWTKETLGDAVARKDVADAERRVAEEAQALEAAAAREAAEVAAFENVSHAAAELERRALAQAGAALAKGRAGDAKAFAALAEQMRKRVESDGAEREQAAEAARLSQEEAERLICDVFVKAAFIANAMVHAPMQAPAAFQGLIKLWREHNLGEGAEDAEAAAAKLAASQAAWLNGRFEDTLPDYVRAQMDEAWAARRVELAEAPPIPRFWKTPEEG